MQTRKIAILELTPSEQFSLYFDIFTTNYLPKIIFALILLIIGYSISKIIKKITARHLAKTNPLAQHFVSNSVFVVILIPFIVMSVAKLGMNPSSIVALIGSAGIAIGLAFQPSLSNISSGLMIVLFRPFKINDYIEAEGVAGSVKDIGLYSTSLMRADNTVIIIPNSKVMSSKLINFSDQKIRRVDIEITLEFSQNIPIVRNLIMDSLLNDNRVVNYPSPTIVVNDFKDYGLVLSIRPWTSYMTYWEVLYELQEEVLRICANNNIHLAKPTVIKEFSLTSNNPQ